MGINKGTLKALGILHKEGFFKNISVMELGSQVVYPSHKNDVRDFLQSIGRINPEKDIKEAKSTKKSFLKKLILHKSRQLSGRTIYELLGVREYNCIDINDELGSINLDLNKEYKFGKQYDLVTNFGTTEHIFNQYSCFKNIHNLTKTGGYIFHGVPVSGFSEHGFYKYSILFFEDLASANDYTIEEFWLCLDDNLYPKDNLSSMKGDILILCLLKKNKNSEFKMPIQGRYDAK
jgi:hypothetical protein